MRHSCQYCPARTSSGADWTPHTVSVVSLVNTHNSKPEQVMLLDRWDYAAPFGLHQGKPGQNCTFTSYWICEVTRENGFLNCFANSCFHSDVKCFISLPLPPHSHILHSHMYLFHTRCMLRSHVNSSSWQDCDRKLTHESQNSTILYEVAAGTRWSLRSLTT